MSKLILVIFFSLTSNSFVQEPDPDMNCTPSGVQLIYPENNQMNISITPTLSWDKVQGADSYHLEVSQSDNFLYSIIDVEDLTETKYEITTLEELEVGTIYLWRVRAQNKCGYGPYYSVYRFVTIP